MIIFIDVNDNATAYIANINNYRNIAMPRYIPRHLLVPYILQVLCNLYQLSSELLTAYTLLHLLALMVYIQK